MTFSLKRNSLLFALGMRRHYAKYGWIWLLALLIVVTTSKYWHLAINHTDSLPQKLFVIQLKERTVRHGDYVAFYPPKIATGGIEMPFVKKVVCLPGDILKVIDRSLYCNGNYVAAAKPKSLKGEPLEVVESKVLDEDEFVLLGTHPDSFDSRYKVFGVINRYRFIGKAFPIF